MQEDHQEKLAVTEQATNISEDIQFTSREVDIIACLLHGRSVKKIAGFFSISPKTVEVHIRNTMLKIGCNSKERIIDFIEASKHHSIIREHYYLILKEKCNIHTNLTATALNNPEPNCTVEAYYQNNPENVGYLKCTKRKIGLSILIVITIITASWIYCYSYDLSTFLATKSLNSKHIEPKYLNRIIINQLVKAIEQEKLSAIKSSVFQAENFLKQATFSVEFNQLRYYLGVAYRYLGKFEEAIVILESINAKEDNNVYVLVELGTNYLKIGEYNKATLLIAKALRIARAKYGLDSIETAYVEIHLDSPYRKLKQYAKAKELLEHSLRVYNASKDLNVIGNIAWIYTKLGYLSVKLGNLDEAVNLFNRSLEIQTNLYGKNHIRTAWTKVRMSFLYKELKNYTKARDLLEHSYKVYKGYYGQKHPKTAWVLGCLAEVELLLNNISKAKNLILEVLAIQTQYYGESSVIRFSWALNILSNIQK